MEPARRRRPRITDRARIFLSGALALIALVVAVLIVIDPLTATHDDLHQIGRHGAPLQEKIVGLRTAIVDWEFFIEHHLDILVPSVALAPTELVKGGELTKAIIERAKALTPKLRSVGFTTDARDLGAGIAAFTGSLTKLGPVASGGTIAPDALRAVVHTERIALERLWRMTTKIGLHVLRNLTEGETTQANQHLALGLWFFAIGAGIDIVIVAFATVAVGNRAGRRERERRHIERLHEYESRVQRALEMTRTEPEVYEIIGAALHESVPELNIELLLADSSRAHFRRALTNDGDFEGCGVVSPLDCPAATGGQTLTFPSSGALDACPYLKNRPAGACSAACVPVSIAGHAVGVTHAIGPDGDVPGPQQVDMLNFASRRGSERIAMIRAFQTSEIQAQTDPLTGLMNRRSLENRVRDFHGQGTPYALAYGDLDHFKDLNDSHGHETGDQALRAFARVLRDAVRPNDIVARFGGEEFVIVLPDCDTDVAVVVLERVRERLALAVGTGRIPSFTVTFGVASTSYAATFDEIVTLADGALLNAKSAGRNRVLVAELPAPAGAATPRRDSKVSSMRDAS